MPTSRSPTPTTPPLRDEDHLGHRLALAGQDLARAERSLTHGSSVFVSGQNLFDRRYLVGRAGIDTEGAPRTFELGLAYHAAAARPAR